MQDKKDDCIYHNHENVLKAKEGILDSKVYDKLSEFYKAFGDVTRLKIMSLLFVSELCVCDIALATDMSQPAISHQMKVLKNIGIVKCRREGKMVYYSLDDDHIELIHELGQKHVKHLIY